VLHRRWAITHLFLVMFETFFGVFLWTEKGDCCHLFQNHNCLSNTIES
jgi:hypothetical protein